MINVESFVEDLRSRIEDPARKEVVVQMGLDLVEAAALQGTDPEMAESLMAHLKAQALTMAATEHKAISDAFMAFATQSARTLIVTALGAL